MRFTAARLFVVFLLALSSLAVGGVLAPGASAVAVPSCDGLDATIVGTDDDDVLWGTPGPDVIDAGDGDDVVYGRGGDDTLCGGNDDDRLFGEAGNDRMFGGNGIDLLVGGDGVDSLVGGSGDDVAYGLAGNDDIKGENGVDRLGGGSDDDAIDGNRGDDALYGGAGDDSAIGGPGDDRCEAETSQECVLIHNDTVPTVSADVVGSNQVSGAEIELSVAVDSESPLALVMVLVNGDIVWIAEPPPGTASFVETVVLDTTELDNGAAEYTVVAVDVEGDHASAEPVVIRLLRPLAPEGPSTVVVLTESMTLDELAPLLATLGQPVVEYRHDRTLAQPIDIPAQVSAAAGRYGIEVLPAPTAVQGGFYGRGLSLADQLATYAALAEEQGFDPQVTALRMEGELSARTEAVLSAVIEQTYDLPGRDGYETTVEFPTSAPASPAAASAVGAAPNPVKSGLSIEESAAVSHLAAAQVEVDNAVFWPSFGQMENEEFDKEVSRLVFWNATEHYVTFQHDVVWAPGVVQSYADLGRAYEHDMKVQTDRTVVGTRPFCILPIFASWDDLFYAYQEDGVMWESNFPDESDPYFDTDVSDDCDKEDMSIGVRKPEVLDDGLGDNQAVSYNMSVTVRRGGPDEGPFTHTAQRLSRLNGAACWFIGTQNCTGLDADAGDGGFILRTNGETIPGITLPTCYTWEWPPDPDQPVNQIANRCSGDSDGDGWDDTVDCDPNDPTINPGAVDIPNDGIDQDCDGSDLVVGQGELQFTLIWDNDNDQDLHVYEPDGYHLWYANPGPSPSGGRLDRDDNVFVCGNDPVPGGVENVFWPDTSTPQSGTYLVEIRQYASCGSPAAWTLQVREGGELVDTVAGTTAGTYSYRYPNISG